MSGEARPRVAVSLCVINYNGVARLPMLLDAAIREGDVYAEILVVDDASIDGSVALLKRCYPDIRTIALATNRGPGAARNAGFAAAHHDLILFQDNDVRLTLGCLDRLCTALAEDPEAVAVAPRVLYATAPETIQYDSADCHFLGHMAPRNADRPASISAAHRARTSSIVTACFLIDRRRWGASAPFDEDFGFNLEDHDFGVHANLRGLVTLVEPKATVLHGEGTAGLSYRPGSQPPQQRMFYLIRNRWFILGKHYALRTLLGLAPVLCLYELFQLVGLARRGWLGTWGSALRALLRSRSSLLRKRRDVQAARRCRDRDILCAGPLPLTQALPRSRLERAFVRGFELVANAYWRLARKVI